MTELFKQPSSRIVQIDGEHALCEDGSVWVQYENRQAPYMWVLASPPHKPPTQAADLAEALEVLRSIAYYVRSNMINLGTLREIVADANKLLDKHGA